MDSPAGWRRGGVGVRGRWSFMRECLAKKKKKKSSALPCPRRYRTCNGSNYWQALYLYTDASEQREKQAKSQSRKLLSHRLNP